jgi:hypothetical protein
MVKRLALTICLVSPLIFSSRPYKLSHITVTGPFATTVGKTAQFQALGLYWTENHHVKLDDITNQVTWASSKTSVATISKAGLAKPGHPGETSINATSKDGRVIGHATLTVKWASPRLVYP